MRNRYHHLHSRVSTFVAARIVLSDEPFDRVEVFNFWTNLAVDPAVANFLLAALLNGPVSAKQYLDTLSFTDFL